MDVDSDRAEDRPPYPAGPSSAQAEGTATKRACPAPVAGEELTPRRLPAGENGRAVVHHRGRYVLELGYAPPQNCHLGGQHALGHRWRRGGVSPSEPFTGAIVD
jgi:hypothetical protein